MFGHYPPEWIERLWYAEAAGTLILVACIATAALVAFACGRLTAKRKRR